MASSIENDLEELLSCAICLGTLSEPKLLPCSHRFCKLCIVMEMDRSASPKGSPVLFPCPLCKREIKLGKGRNGEEWILNFETDRLLKDIQELLKQEHGDAKWICLSHRKKLSLVCYSCRTTGCYICAWQDHRSCSDVKNLQDEAKRMKADLQKHLEESEKCIEKIVPYVERWSSVRKSLKNQLDYSNRFIEEHLQHLQRESVSAVEDLLQEYECYIKRTSMSKEIEQEIRSLMETFPIKIHGDITIFDMQSQLQSQNETILFPQINEASERLESVKDVTFLMSTVENIKQVLDLGFEDFVLKSKDLLAQKSYLLTKSCHDTLVQSIDSTLPRVVQVSMITRLEQIHLENDDGSCLLRDLNIALQNAQNPMELVETTGRLCYPDGYHPQFVIEPVVALKKRRRSRKSKTNPKAQFSDVSQVEPEAPSGPMIIRKITKTQRPKEFRVEHVTYPRYNFNPRKKLYDIQVHHQDEDGLSCTLYNNDEFTNDKNLSQREFNSFNALQNKGNGEPFPTKIQTIVNSRKDLGIQVESTWHIFENTDDEEEGRESERVVQGKCWCGRVSRTSMIMSYQRERFLTRYSNKLKEHFLQQKESLLGVKLFLVSLFVCIAVITIIVVHIQTMN